MKNIRQCLDCRVGVIVSDAQCLLCSEHNPHGRVWGNQVKRNRLMKLRHWTVWRDEFGYPDYVGRKCMISFMEF